MTKRKLPHERLPMGRPFLYTEELAQRICDDIATNPLSTHEICNNNPDYPTFQTFYSWMKKIPILIDMYSRAKEAQAEVLVDDMLNVAHKSSTDNVENADKKILVDVLKWNAARLKPNKYSDRIIVDDNKGIEEIVKKTKQKLEKAILNRKKNS